ncbi:enoyl-CoA hydratase/isomerase family protein [Corynebacterium sp. 153RC1]|uniref:enoyl-CoA hydratase/isomerase family protein n=1 Tax=unclassified Corynebacterium TaxID=2624378 RepID=UPI00211C2FCD|nr:MULTISPECIES: enoyl-CoA hydratase/isomerase family protein [unclassified Corynebacterium]MCQ9353430.1 enoyl-CoA hydratase/isomerase family protein [Corynebacterium sp. 209RC1]MCQ9355652.1 enoyl-CoA hydratase/isomerase family protein [Corynebacterium sp. 1222RC1]MCQ9357845.1 enoyl-CoA hydratase/isomerase family protein [Corynebacterium sp. 122RC1]MCQ9360029.1 enoyl-CoA hydratase/isomerase family protein [Corynebacterium sp. 142RC1]MCQ9362173.1 enoyl-CoA hydratase/isomerase family protein [Co
MTELVRGKVENGIGFITLDRPKALNALTFEMLRTIERHLTEFGENPTVRAVLIHGEGKAFCAGDDLIDMGSENYPVPDVKLDEYLHGYPQTCQAIRDCPKPVIVAIHRYALGAAFELALASDFIVAEKSAKVGLPFVLRGFAAGTNLLSRLTNRHFASRLLFTGEIVEVTELEKFGLTYSLVDNGTAFSEAANLAMTLATLPTKSISLMKSSIQASEAADEKSSWLIQAHSTVSSSLTEDHEEGRSAFKEKRNPSFRGR